MLLSSLIGSLKIRGFPLPCPPETESAGRTEEFRARQVVTPPHSERLQKQTAVEVGDGWESGFFRKKSATARNESRLRVLARGRNTHEPAAELPKLSVRDVRIEFRLQLPKCFYF